MSGEISSLEEYVKEICTLGKLGGRLCYRGQPESGLTLKPVVFRKQAYVDAEHTLLRDLVALHPEEFASDSTTLERLVRARHYSLPTRLLDVTWNPLVALYFAAQTNSKRTGEVIVFRIEEGQFKFYDSDTVSCVANLAHLRPEEKKRIDDLLNGKGSVRRKKFNREPPVDRLLQFIRMEKSYFRDRIVPKHLKTVLCVKPKQNNPRILAQAGAFLLFATDRNLESHPVPGITAKRIEINKAEILGHLDTMGVKEHVLFPEIENAAKYLGKAVADANPVGTAAPSTP